MKTLFSFLFTALVVTSYSQTIWTESFETPNDSCRYKFYIDTIHCAHNLWQVGKPQKVDFDSAYSPVNALVTDTIHTYPANDTSIFYLTQTSFPKSGFVLLQFFYKLDIDPLSSVKVEISGDNGLNWINTVTEDTTYMFDWGGSSPNFDTSVTYWRDFSLMFGTWLGAYPGGPFSFPHYVTSDSLLFKFTFISGPDATVHKDGWILDNFKLEWNYLAGVNSPARQPFNKFIITPNPSDGDVWIKSNDGSLTGATITISDISGREIFTAPAPEDGHLQLNISNGLYFIRIVPQNGMPYVHKLVIVH